MCKIATDWTHPLLQQELSRWDWPNASFLLLQWTAGQEKGILALQQENKYYCIIIRSLICSKLQQSNFLTMYFTHNFMTMPFLCSDTCCWSEIKNRTSIFELPLWSKLDQTISETSVLIYYLPSTQKMWKQKQHFSYNRSSISNIKPLQRLNRSALLVIKLITHFKVLKMC